ncbi:hypothetical protein MUB24_15500 [Lederbergia sp. NSJ-179]|uniref:hypothetical protein n=1 Tax=Lederbergia sp. NSJ-179 TaxID=2931402 RepID=UPI001FD14C6F|nr:hypothetical protein [Lederbergia sp. NSJ-179]MCJ7842275.1 hypothetical protein [Lederbergia sp. NSJ-179]
MVTSKYKLASFDIDWKNYTHDAFIEKRNLALASGELPDAILDAGFSNYDLLKYAKDETIIPVEDLIDQYKFRADSEMD